MTRVVHGERGTRGRRRRGVDVPDFAFVAAFFALVWLVNGVAAILSLWAFQELGVVAPPETASPLWAD